MMLRKIFVSFCLGFLTAALLFNNNNSINNTIFDNYSNKSNSSNNNNYHNNDCIISFGKFNGLEYTVKDKTIGKPKCLVESEFLRVQQHHVKLDETSNDSIPDWIFIDYNDGIQALVEVPEKPGVFLILEQTKYALGNQLSLAVVGGMMEPGENNLLYDTVKREIMEELHVDCNQYHFLGRYRTDVNRGMGWTYTYLATDCTTPSKQQQQLNTNNSTGTAALVVEDTNNTVLGIADMEEQTTRMMSTKEVLDAVMAGKFMEIQWTATVALSMLKLKQNNNKKNK